MIINDFEDLIKNDINTRKDSNNSFDIDIYTLDWRHYELVDLGGNCEKNEHGYTKLLDFKMKKVMISQPMNGLTDEEIKNVKLKAIEELSKKHYVVVDSFFTSGEECDWADTQHNIPIAYLALSLKKMAEVDAVYFCEGWSKARGCVIEHEVAKNYGLEILGYNS